MKLSNETWACVGLVSVILTLAVIGTPAHEKVVAENLTVNQHLAAVHLQAEKHEFQFVGAPGVYEGTSYAGKGRYSKYKSWTIAPATKWTVVNRWSFGGECKELFNQLAEYNKIAYLSPDEVQMLAKSYQEKSIALWAFTPKFTQEPDAMASCAQQGLAYDRTLGMLTAKGKPIALLAHPYPHWARVGERDSH